eukprot:30279-Pelagococcus_subviridis.AAC.2
MIRRPSLCSHHAGVRVLPLLRRARARDRLRRGPHRRDRRHARRDRGHRRHGHRRHHLRHRLRSAALHPRVH